MAGAASCRPPLFYLSSIIVFSVCWLCLSCLCDRHLPEKKIIMIYNGWAGSCDVITANCAIKTTSSAASHPSWLSLSFLGACYSYKHRVDNGPMSYEFRESNDFNGECLGKEYVLIKLWVFHQISLSIFCISINQAYYNMDMQVQIFHKITSCIL